MLLLGPRKHKVLSRVENKNNSCLGPGTSVGTRKSSDNVVCDGAEVMFDGSSFDKLAPTTGKDHLLMSSVADRMQYVVLCVEMTLCC